QTCALPISLARARLGVRVVRDRGRRARHEERAHADAHPRARAGSPARPRLRRVQRPAELRRDLRGARRGRARRRDRRTLDDVPRRPVALPRGARRPRAVRATTGCRRPSDTGSGRGGFAVDRDAVKAKLSTDGGARGNPGPAAYGYVLEAEDGTLLDKRGEAIGVATNNLAEYRALVAGLEAALASGVTELDVVSDSELLVKQMRGEYRVKNAALRSLFAEATRLAGELGTVSYHAVRREHNELADRLVNDA